MDPWLVVFGVGAYHFMGLIIAEVSLRFYEQHEPAKYHALRWGNHFWAGYVALVMLWPAMLVYGAFRLMLTK